MRIPAPSTIQVSCQTQVPRSSLEHMRTMRRSCPTRLGVRSKPDCWRTIPADSDATSTVDSSACQLLALPAVSAMMQPPNSPASSPRVRARAGSGCPARGRTAGSAPAGLLAACPSVPAAAAPQSTAPRGCPWPTPWFGGSAAPARSRSPVFTPPRACLLRAGCC